jgi:hypothetical protein
MGFAKARLMITLGLLAAWLGYIAYQAVAIGRFPTVSHAQMLNATVGVVADVEAGGDGRPAAKAHVREVLWPADQARLLGQDIDVSNLPKALLPSEDPRQPGPFPPGRYVVPLEFGPDGQYHVAGVPRSPSFNGQSVYFLYPDTPLTRQQLDAIPKATPETTAPAATSK